MIALQKNDLTTRIIQSRLGLHVERCHNIPHRDSYSVGKHTAGCLLLAWYLYREDFHRLAPVIMAHDIPEGWFGDIPSPAMTFTPGLKEGLGKGEANVLNALDLPHEMSLAPELQKKYKACDRLEFFLWCLEQKAQGNRYVDEPIKYMEMHLTADQLPGEAFVFFERLKHMDIVPKQATVVKEALA